MFNRNFYLPTPLPVTAHRYMNLKKFNTLYRAKLVNYIPEIVQENLLTPSSAAKEVIARFDLLQVVQLIAASWRKYRDHSELLCSLWL
jgi:hypothetical protein